MSILIPLLASVVLLLGSGFLISTVGRRRHRRRRALVEREVAAIAGVVGSGLAELVAGAVNLRQKLEDVAASGREMLAVEHHLGGSLRRPLWRQIEDANFGHELDALRREILGWIAGFEALGPADRIVVERLDLGIEPVRELACKQVPPLEALRDRSDELRELQGQLDDAIACLRRLEAEIAGYRGGGYR